MRRHLPRFFVLAFAALLLVVGTAARSAEIDMSGTWTGTYGTDDPNVMAKVIITIKEASGKYSGSISLPDEKLMIGIRTSAMDDGFFAVSGVLTSKDPNGNPVQAHVTFGGFVDDDGTAWDGTWSVGDKDGRIAVSNLFSVTREAKVAQPKPVTGGPQPGKKTTIGTIAPKPDTSKPATQTPTGTDQSVISGTWTGTFRASNQTAGTMTIKMSQNRGGYSGTGEVVDDDGTTIPPITFSDGKQSGKKNSPCPEA